ncbi:MAG: efflux RND transporter permease subunit [Deltaproteobacteria bacterium]|nr:efflux RND transporter permease subunit [Deltaproteobacteria bacterium]
MSLSSGSVKHGITTLMAYVVAIGFGVFSLSRLGLDMYPDITFPLAGIVTTYEGTSPEDMEQLVSRTLEEAAASVEGVTQVTSTSKQGASVVFVEFDWGYDIDQGEIDLRKSIDFVRGYLPPDASSPITFAFNPSMQPIMFLFLSGNYDQKELRDIAVHDLEPRLERLPGVASVDTYGGLEREIRVEVLPQRLQSYRIAVPTILQALRTENLQIPAGSLEQGGQEFSIISEGRFQTVEEIRNLVIGYKQAGMAETPLGQKVPTAQARLVPVRLRDVADVLDTFHEATRVVRANGESSVFITIRKQSGANTALAAAAVREELESIRKLLPEVQIRTLFDQSDFIRASLGNLSNTALQALLFSFLVLLVFLASVRGALVVAIAIPVSVVVTFAAMDQLGLTLNLLSMAGLALAIGMLVDNSIVVLENIVRLVECGYEPKEAAAKGASEVGMAVTASTLTTLAVFAPIPFVPGIAGLLFRDMALTIVVSLTASLVVALTLVPVLAAWMLSREKGRGMPWYRRWVLGAINAVRDGYVWLLRGVLRFRKTTLLGVVALLVATSALAFQGLGFDFFPKTDQGFSAFQLEAPVGTSLAEADRRSQEIERIVTTEIPEVELAATDIGMGEGFIAIFGEGAHAGMLRLKYQPLAQRSRYQKDIEVDVVERLRRVPGVEVSTFAPAIGGSGSDIEIELYIDDLAQAREVGLDLKKKVQQIEGVGNVSFSLDEGKPEYRIALDRERMAALGVMSVSVTNTVQAFFQGVIATRFREGGDDYNILVRAPRDYRLDVRDLRRLPVATLQGKQVPLSEVAEVVPAIGPLSVTRKNQQRLVTIGATVPGENLGDVSAAVEKLLADYRFPPDATYFIGGTAEDLRDTQRYMGIALLIALLLVYMVMASQFESLLEPFIIFFTMPLAIIGIAVVLLVTGMPMSVPAIIGIVILVGIVVNNGIVLVDRANQSHRGESKPLLESVIEAGRLRFRPVLMTALTTILSMIPLALGVGEGAETWAPMARIIIGGLTAAAFLTLFIVPIAYLMVVGFVERFREHGMLRLLPAYLGFWAFAFAAVTAGLGWFSTTDQADPALADQVPMLVGTAVVFVAAFVVAAVGIYKRKAWGWWTGMVGWGLLALAGAGLAAYMGTQGGPEMRPVAVGGVILFLVALPVLRPLVKRRGEFGFRVRQSTLPPSSPPGACSTEDGQAQKS